MNNLPENKKIILFDGVCNLCEYSIQFIIKNDPKDVFRFVAQQSDLGQAILRSIGVNSKNIESIIFYEPGKAYYTKAEAVFKIAKELNNGYFIISYFSFLGKSVNFIYDFVAKNRYKWFGKKNQCMIPTKEIMAKFL